MVDDLVRTGRLDAGTAARARGGDDVGSRPSGEWHGVPAHGAAGAVDEHPLTGPEAAGPNAGGMTVAALVSARLAGRFATRTVMLVGQVLALAAGAGMLVGALWLGTPLGLALGCFFALMVAIGLVIGNAGALANAAVPQHPGTGSAVLGMLQWGTAGVAAPLAGLGGEHSAVPVAVLMTVGALVSQAALLVVVRDGGRPAASPVADR